MSGLRGHGVDRVAKGLHDQRPAPAGLILRSAARGIDLALVTAITTFVVTSIVPDLGTAEAVQLLRIGGELTPARAIANTIIAISALAYAVGFETARSITPGKRIFGLCVVDADGLPITRRQALIRNSWLALPALPWLGTLALGMFAFMIATTIVTNRAHIGWHDELARTAVVHLRARAVR